MKILGQILSRKFAIFKSISLLCIRLNYRAATMRKNLFALCMVAELETAAWLLYKPSTPKRRAFLLLNYRVMEQAQQFKKSEFSVSEETAKWVRLIQALQNVWNEANLLVDNEETFMRDFYPHFAAIENQCANNLGQTVLENMGWKDKPDNMI